MKRSTVAALVIGAVVSALIIAAHATRLTQPIEEATMRLLVGERTATPAAPAVQYILVVLLGIGSAWLVLATARRRLIHWPIVLIALQLITVVWVCLLYQVFFQPLPSLFALVLGFATAHGYVATRGRSRSGVAREYFAGRVSDEQRARIASGEVAFEPTAKGYEVTAVVCDIANKHDLAEECAPGELTEITEKFLEHATHSFLEAGAYLDTVAGEGIVALFGFPGEEEDQAEKATRHALQLLKFFDERRERGRDPAFAKFDVHLGISSGTMTMAPVQLDGRSMLLATGEPVELARRFCIANRFYGSRILIGPKTFELTSRTILARPIDFLSGVDARERHEIYEPLKLAADATPEEVARRDSFWSGVVFYREKRWGEAYTQFQQARGPGEDPPLQLYLRRIEPLALHLAIADDT